MSLTSSENVDGEAGGVKVRVQTHGTGARKEKGERGEGEEGEEKDRSGGWGGVGGRGGVEGAELRSQS